MKNVFVHPKGICESETVGSGTKIWAFAHVLPKAKVGEECNICDHVFIENDVVVGDRVTLKCGVQLWDGLRIEDDVFIGPNATFTNDSFPRSKKRPAKFEETVIRKGASIGANATIMPGITIGRNAMVGAGTVVTRSVPPNAIVVGNPARIVGYVDTGAATKVKSKHAKPNIKEGIQASKIAGAALHILPRVHDLRGDLSVGEFEKSVPFTPKRYFLVFDVPSREIRGEHAHKVCEQFLVCVKGSVSVLVDDGENREEFFLDSPELGFYIPPKVWGVQYKYSPDAVLLVFASHYYDPKDYIRDYDEFLKLTS